MSNNKVKLIKQVQAYLILAGYDLEDTLIADGEWGDVSVKVMTAFQTANDFELTGAIDGKMVQVMYHEKLDLPEGKWTVKQRQASLILEGYVADGELIADGEWGPMSWKAIDELLSIGSEGNYVNKQLFHPDDFPVDV